ncbi:MAG TPA: hypothetical protein VN618_14350 [Solirubrobacteraceae bacterium]|nr:hypothetical protein [Solirubrobacteraceae bacterium]
MVAARLYPAATVGRDTVLLAIMVELSAICQLNLTTATARFLPGLGARGAPALRRAYTATFVASLVAGSAFVLAAPAVLGQFRFLTAEPWLAVAFVSALAAWGVFVLQDAALAALRRASLVPVETALFGVLKLAALPALLVFGRSDGVFLAWVLAMPPLIVVVNLLIFRSAIPAAGPDGAVPPPGAARFLAADYLGSVLSQASMTMLPLAVLATLGSRQSAYFAIPFAIVTAFDTLAAGASVALIVEGGRNPDRLPSLARAFGRRVGLPLIPAAAALALGAPALLTAFGASYARHGTGALRLLLAASVARIVLALFTAVARAKKQGARLALLNGATLVLLAAAFPVARSHGITGIAAAWLAANAVVCLPVVWQLGGLLRGSPS